MTARCALHAAFGLAAGLALAVAVNVVLGR